MKQLLETVSWQPLLGSLVTLSSLVATLLVSRANRWLRALLELERQASEKQIAELHERELRRSNETLRILTTASAPVEPPTLASLLADEKRDFSLTSCETQSFPWPTPKAAPGLGPRKPTSRTSGSRKATDWSDDDEITAPAPISSYPPPEPQANKP